MDEEDKNIQKINTAKAHGNMFLLQDEEMDDKLVKLPSHTKSEIESQRFEAPLQGDSWKVVDSNPDLPPMSQVLFIPPLSVSGARV